MDAAVEVEVQVAKFTESHGQVSPLSGEVALKLLCISCASQTLEDWWNEVRVWVSCMIDRLSAVPEQVAQLSDDLVLLGR